MAMRAIQKYVKDHVRNQKGQGIVEYALILAFVVVIAMALTNSGGLQEKIKNVFTSVGNEVDKAGTSNEKNP